MSLSLSHQTINAEVLEQYILETETFEDIVLVEQEEEEYEDDLFLVNLNGEESVANEFAMYNDLYQFNESNANSYQLASSVEASEVYVSTYSLSRETFTLNEVELANVENEIAQPEIEMKREFKPFLMNEERPELPEHLMVNVEGKSMSMQPMMKPEYRDMGAMHFEMPEMPADMTMIA